MTSADDLFSGHFTGAPAPDPATRATGIADYRPTVAQEIMRQDIEAAADREPKHVSSVLDELFNKMAVQRAARAKYDTSMQRQAFIAGAEWWASHGL